MIRRSVLIPLAFFLTLVFVACDPSGTDRQQEALPLSAWLPLSINDVSFEVQIPLTRAEQARGLMHREHLGTDRGMLFPYTNPQQMTFWMKDTLIPLDIGFFDANGVLREVYQMYPRDTRTIRSRRSDLHYALEMNQGWFRSNNIRAGAQLDMDQLAAALTARGANPSNFGLPRN